MVKWKDIFSKSSNEKKNAKRAFEVKLHKDGIEFSEYPFAPATLGTNIFLKAESIKEIITNFNPPAIRISENELVFIPRNLLNNDELIEFGKRNGVNIVFRSDIWSWILEEFLDTEFGEESKENVMQCLERQGIGRVKCEMLRMRVEKIMTSYNFDSCLWEWCYLGLYDLLNAGAGILVKSQYKLSEKEFEELYWDAMKIALQGQVEVREF